MKTKVAQLMKLGYSVTEIAKVTGTTRPTVYRRMNEMPFYIKFLYKVKRKRF